MAARATHHQEGSGDALELAGRDIGARVALHALDGALDLRWLHCNGHPKSSGAMTLHTVLLEDLAHPQRPEHGHVALVLATSGGTLASRCCSSRTCVIRAMVRMRLTSTISMTTMRKAGNRGGRSSVISDCSFRATQCTRWLSRRLRADLRRRQLFMDRQNARQPAERKQR